MPELEAVFLDHIEAVDFFTGMSRQPCDVWEVDVSGLWIEMHENWLIHRSPIPSDRLCLVVADLPVRTRNRRDRDRQAPAGLGGVPDESSCPKCHRRLRYRKLHTGFNKTGFAYCGSDGALVVWEVYDPHYMSIVDLRQPWTLDRRDQERVEASLLPCPCGGRFGMCNSPLCPDCGHELQDLFSDPIYFIDFGERFDADRDEFWGSTRSSTEG
jgi:hypothetical protein